MNRRTGLVKLALIGGIVIFLAAGGGGAAYLAIKSKRDAAVRDALAYLPAAEQEFKNGQFAKSVETVAEAAKRHAANPTWFQPGDEARIREAGELLARRLDLWKRVEAAASGIGLDPAKARAELEKLSTEAEKVRPIAERLAPHLQSALAQERAGTCSSDVSSRSAPPSPPFPRPPAPRPPPASRPN
jgi:hypothetical protein